MAITMTATTLRRALRLTDTDAATTAIVTRLLGTATSLVLEHAPDAPDAVHNEAVVRLAGYLYDAPTSGPGAGYAHAWRNSGAQSMTAPWTSRRAGAVVP